MNDQIEAEAGDLFFAAVGQALLDMESNRSSYSAKLLLERVRSNILVQSALYPCTTPEEKEALVDIQMSLFETLRVAADLPPSPS